VARALLVGCGCRGRELGRRLVADGWAVRGTTRAAAGAARIGSAGIEPAIADPDRVATVLDHVGDVGIVFWLLGSARGNPEAVAAVHGPRLERLLEELVDTPVRGFVYEASGAVPAADLTRGKGIVRAASERWRIPSEIVGHDPADASGWVDAMARAAARLVA
jgi:uncharacterized protein YbjT (DUF2867 family)